MPNLTECVKIIEERCHTKGNVITIPLNYLLAIKSYLVLCKDLCEAANSELLSLFDIVDQATISDIAKEEYL